MIQLLVRNVLRLGFKRYVYPNMTAGNFKLIWTLLVNNLKSLPLRSILSVGMSLGSNQKIVRALTAERFVEPILKNQGILKPEIKDGNSEILVKTLFSLIGLGRATRFVFKVLLWLPKLVLTLFILSLTNIDVTFLQSAISWLTFGISNSLTLLFTSLWGLLVYIFRTGDILNLNFLKSISEPLSLEDILRSKSDKEITNLISETGEEIKPSSKWSTSSKNLIKIGCLFVLNITIKYFLDTTIVSTYLQDHPWLNKGADFFQWTYKFGKDINTVLIDNLPLYGRAEKAVTSIVGGVLTYSYICLDTVVATPAKWGWEATTKIYNYGIKTPFNSIWSWFSPSEETLAELKRLKEENENLKAKGLKRKGSLSSIGTYIKNWRAGAVAAPTPKNPKVTTTDIKEDLPSGTSAWGNSAPVTPITPIGEGNFDPLKGSADPALSVIEEESESTPKSKLNDLADDEEGPSLPGFDI